MTKLTYRAFPFLAASIVVVATAAPASAQQTVVGAWPQIRVDGLQTVYVRDTVGSEVQGKLLALDPESLNLLVDGVERRMQRSEVSRIQRRDGLRNGIVIGAAAGVLMGLVTGGISDCPGAHPGGSCAGFRAFTAVASFGIWTAVGAGIDALIPGRTTLYAAPPRAVASGGDR